MGTSLLIQPSLGPILVLIFLQFPQVFGHPLSGDDLMLPSKSTELFMSLSCRDGKVGGPSQAWLGRGTPTCSSSGCRFPGMNCFLASASSWSVVGLSPASHEHTSLTGVVLGEIVLFHRRTGCHQASGLLGLVCIYLYGVNFEPQFWAAWGEQALRCTAVRLSPASQHHCSEVLLLSPLLGEKSLEVSVQGGL